MININFDNRNSFSNEEIEILINKHNSELALSKKSWDYYYGKHDFINSIVSERTNKDPYKPNYKIQTNILKPIVAQKLGFLLGKAITYKHDDIEKIEIVNIINKTNNTKKLDGDIYKDALKTGYGVELHYQDVDGSPKIMRVPIFNIVPIYDMEDNLRCAIKYIKKHDELLNKDYYMVEIYWDNRVEYKVGDSIINLRQSKLDQTHEYGMVPVNILTLNNGKSDYYRVLDKVDQLDLKLSDMSNELDYFSNSIMVMNNVDISQLKQKNPNFKPKLDENGNIINEHERFYPMESIIDDMKRKLFIAMPTNVDGKTGDIKYLQLQLNTENYRNYIKDMNELIFNDVNVPNLMNTDLMNNSSGVAIDFKFNGMIQDSINKENIINEFIKNRLRLMFIAYKARNGYNLDENEFTMIFTRTYPRNELERAETLVKYKELGVSDQTTLAHTEIVDDVNYELENRDNQLLDQDTL